MSVLVDLFQSSDLLNMVATAPSPSELHIPRLWTPGLVYIHRYHGLSVFVNSLLWVLVTNTKPWFRSLPGFLSFFFFLRYIFPYVLEGILHAMGGGG